MKDCKTWEEVQHELKELNKYKTLVEGIENLIDLKSRHYKSDLQKNIKNLKLALNIKSEKE